jgi:hypothetical protein
VAAVPDIDIWRSAKILVDNHGADAPVVASMRAAEMINRGDGEGLAVWKRIMAAIDELLNTTPGGPAH